MCGFLAAFTEDVNHPIHQVVQGAGGEELAHRGPDFSSTYTESGVSIRFFRLSIVDVAATGHQPMQSACERFLIAYNGEIYNFRSLASRFGVERGLRGASDTEILLELLAKHGKEIIRELRGMFAFVLFDRVQKRFLAVRDNFGIKPLYFCKFRGGIIFSSEMKPLLKCGSSKIGIDRANVYRYLWRGDIDDTQATLFESISQVLPGQAIYGDSSRQTVENLLPLDLSVENRKAGLDSEYEDLLVSVVRDYLFCDVEAGVSLSGGFDSSLLAALVKNVDRARSRPMFCRGYANYEGNEFEAAREVAETNGFEFHPVTLYPEEVPSLIRKCSLAQEHPITSISILAFHKLYQEASRMGIKVLLEGHGGDEIWAGYNHYHKRFLDSMGARSTLNQDGTHREFNSVIFREEYPEGFTPQIRSVSGYHESSSLTKMQIRDMYEGKMQRMLRAVDRASMSASVEVRLPFLHQDVVTNALNIPDLEKVRGDTMRYAIRRAASNFIGTEKAFTPKMLVQDPQREWIQLELKEYMFDMLLSKNLWIDEFVDTEELRREYENFLVCPEEYKNLTFLMYPIFLQVWYESLREWVLSENILSMRGAGSLN